VLFVLPQALHIAVVSTSNADTRTLKRFERIEVTP
jgi:hypothetical protein